MFFLFALKQKIEQLRVYEGNPRSQTETRNKTPFIVFRVNKNTKSL